MTKQSCPFTVSFIAEISDTVGSRYLALHSLTLAAVALVQFITHMARNFGHFRTETSCGLHEGFIYTAGIHGKVRADPTN